MVMILGAKESWIFILWDEKVFLPPSLIFYPLFLPRKFTENRFWTFKTPNIQTRKGGKELVEGGKKLLHFLEEHLSFNLYQKSLLYLKTHESSSKGAKIYFRSKSGKNKVPHLENYVVFRESVLINRFYSER